ncbi:hypothetical protein B0H14DRAFT_2647404 [Mycena olivaceomarginata]|nr:hypothetical protein B0H14DRAFT_2647404 [Mycena olivaceomarginata]
MHRVKGYEGTESEQSFHAARTTFNVHKEDEQHTDEDERTVPEIIWVKVKRVKDFGSSTQKTHRPRGPRRPQDSVFGVLIAAGGSGGSRKVEVLHLAMILEGGVDGVKDWTGDVDVHGEYEIRTVEGILDFLKVSTGLPEITGRKIDCVIVIGDVERCEVETHHFGQYPNRTGLKSAREPSGATGVENERGGPEARFLGLVRAVGAVELPGWVRRPAALLDTGSNRRGRCGRLAMILNRYGRWSRDITESHHGPMLNKQRINLVFGVAAIRAAWADQNRPTEKKETQRPSTDLPRANDLFWVETTSGPGV